MADVGLLPMGHTHTDKVQALGTNSIRLKVHESVTRAEVHADFRKCYNVRTRVSGMQNGMNWSQLCDDADCINKTDNMMNYRYFRISWGTGGDAEHLQFNLRCRCVVVATITIIHFFSRTRTYA